MIEWALIPGVVDWTCLAPEIQTERTSLKSKVTSHRRHPRERDRPFAPDITSLFTGVRVSAPLLIIPPRRGVALFGGRNMFHIRAYTNRCPFRSASIAPSSISETLVWTRSRD